MATDRASSGSPPDDDVSFLVDDGTGRLRPRLTTDPSLSSLFRTDPPSPPRRRHPIRYVAAAVAVLLVAVAVGYAVQRATAPGDGPAVAPVVASGTPQAAAPGAGTPTAATAGPTQARSPAGPSGPAGPSVTPLTEVVNPDVAAGGPMRTAAAVGLAANPDVRLAPEAREPLLAGLVDVRLTTMLATLAAQTPLRINGFSSVAGDPAAAPLRQVVVATVDPSAVSRFDQALAEQTGDYAMEVVADGSDGQLIRLATPGRQ